MLTEKETKEKLKDLAIDFSIYMRNKAYARAKKCYDDAITISVFMQLPIAFRMELFGNKPYVDKEEDIEDGLFVEAEVQRAYLMCLKNEEELLEAKKKRVYERMQKNRTA